VRCTHFRVYIKCICNFKTTRDIALWYACQYSGIGTVSLFVQYINACYATRFGCNQKQSWGIMKLLVERALNTQHLARKCPLHKYFNNACWLLLVKVSAFCIVHNKTPQESLRCVIPVVQCQWYKVIVCVYLYYIQYTYSQKYNLCTINYY
jgi:hypothetical protein